MPVAQRAQRAQEPRRRRQEPALAQDWLQDDGSRLLQSGAGRGRQGRVGRRGRWGGKGRQGGQPSPAGQAGGTGRWGRQAGGRHATRFQPPPSLLFQCIPSLSALPQLPPLISQPACCTPHTPDFPPAVPQATPPVATYCWGAVSLEHPLQRLQRPPAALPLRVSLAQGRHIGGHLQAGGRQRGAGPSKGQQGRQPGVSLVSHVRSTAAGKARTTQGTYALNTLPSRSSTPIRPRPPRSPAPQPPAASCSAGSTDRAPSPRLQPRQAGRRAGGWAGSTTVCKGPVPGNRRPGSAQRYNTVHSSVHSSTWQYDCVPLGKGPKVWRYTVLLVVIAMAP